VIEKVTTLAVPPYRVTALPLAPVDGQMVVLTDSVASATYNWWLVYNAASGSAYKWEFIGGTPKVASNYGSADAQTTAGTWQVLTNSPSCSVPNAGDYWVRAFEGLTNNTGIANSAYMGVCVNSVVATRAAEPGTNFAGTGVVDSNLYLHEPRTLAAGNTLNMCHFLSSAGGTGMTRGGTSGVRGRGIEVVPRRLG